MGTCTPEPRTQSTHTSNQVEQPNSHAHQYQHKRIHRQILLEPYSFLRATNSKLQDASTRGTLQRAPTIIQAIDQYHREHGYNQDKQLRQEPINIPQTNSHYIYEQSSHEDYSNHDATNSHQKKYYNLQNRAQTSDFQEKKQKQKGGKAEPKKVEFSTGKAHKKQTITI